MSRKGKEKQATKKSHHYSRIQHRLQKHLDTAAEWLLNPKQHIPKAWKNKLPQGLQRLPPDQQLSIYQPDEKIVINTQSIHDTQPLTYYLQQEKKQHSGKRLFIIPLFIDDHWTVLILHINQKNQLVSAHFIDSMGKPLNASFLIDGIKYVYSGFNGDIQQHKHYTHPDKALSEFVMTENVEAFMKHFYFKPFPLRPALWSVIPTPASNPDVSAFEERIPVELQLYIFTLLEHQDRIRLATIHKDKLRFLDDPKIWELLYHRWRSYVLPSTLKLKKPNSDKTAFKQLYSSLPPLERKLIIAAFHGDSTTLRR